MTTRLSSLWCGANSAASHVGSFVALAVAQHAVDPAIGSVALGRQRHPSGHRQAVAKRSAGDLDAGHTFVRGVARKRRAVLIERLEILDREKARFSEDRVETGTGVPFAQDETIALRPLRLLRIEPKEFSIEHGENVRGREGGPDVRGIRAARHLDAVHTDAPRELRRREAGVPHDSSWFQGLSKVFCSELELSRV